MNMLLHSSGFHAMIRVVRLLCFAALFMTFFGCAKTFRPIHPGSYTFPSGKLLKDSVWISEIGDVQRLSGNERYSKKEHRCGMMCVAVKVRNESSRTITLTSKNIRLFHGSTEITLITPAEYTHRVKQHRGWYLFHALWGHAMIAAAGKTFFDSNGDTESDVLSIATVAMYNIPIGNIAVASRANLYNLQTLQQRDILGRIIQPGETVYGLLLVRSLSDSIRIQWNPPTGIRK